jgi:hypothetical protein
VTGGTRITLDEFGLTTLVVLAQDPLVINSLSRRSAAIQARAAELQRHLAVRKLHVVQEVTGQLAGRPTVGDQSPTWLAAARKSIQLSDGHLTTQTYPAAYVEARRAMRALRLVERNYWDAAIRSLPSPLTSPGAVAFNTLPWHWRLADRLVRAQWGPNQLPGGDFEDFKAMVQGGWKHFFLGGSENLKTTAELAAGAARSGAAGLRLVVQAEDPESAPALIETPAVWVTTPSLPVEAGMLVRIQGWVRIPKPVAGSVDGLLIIDSLGGEDVAARIGQSPGWKAFALDRIAPRSGIVNATFVLTGLGEVHLDDVVIQLVGTPNGVAQRRPFPRELR